MVEIYKNLFQFTSYIPFMDFTIHQYLYNSEPAILFAAGTVQQAEANIQAVKNILGGKSLRYIFVSHMESDEAGAVSIFLKEYPDVSIICGQLAARELPGFGYKGRIQAVNAGELITDGELKLRFINYPSEVHLQDGLICFEENSRILYSADLFLKFGNGEGKTIKSDWNNEVQNLSENRIPLERLEVLRNSLREINPKFVAVGHGFCTECE